MPDPMPTPTTAPLRLAELPPRLRRKIRLDTGPEADETAACWLWTATVKRGRSRFRHFVPGPDYDGARRSPGAFRNDRDTPMVRSAEYGYPVPANRAVYAAAHRQPVKSVPFLKRCANSLCVSPHHTLPQDGRMPRFRCREVGEKAADAAKNRRDGRRRPNLGIVGPSGAITRALPERRAAPPAIRSATPFADPLAARPVERLAPAAALQRLRDADVSPYQAPEDAAREAGIAPADVTAQVWSLYYQEAQD